MNILNQIFCQVDYYCIYIGMCCLQEIATAFDSRTICVYLHYSRGMCRNGETADLHTNNVFPAFSSSSTMAKITTFALCTLWKSHMGRKIKRCCFWVHKIIHTLHWAIFTVSSRFYSDLIAINESKRCPNYIMMTICKRLYSCFFRSVCETTSNQLSRWLFSEWQAGTNLHLFASLHCLFYQKVHLVFSVNTSLEFLDAV